MKKLMSKILSRFRTPSVEPEEGQEEKYETISVHLKDEEITKICRAFDLQQSAKKQFISKEEFMYIPEDIQIQIKVAIFTGNVVEETLVTNKKRIRENLKK